jgi:hypothetical protein
MLVIIVSPAILPQDLRPVQPVETVSPAFEDASIPGERLGRFGERDFEVMGLPNPLEDWIAVDQNGRLVVLRLHLAERRGALAAAHDELRAVGAAHVAALCASARRGFSHKPCQGHTASRCRGWHPAST